MAGVSNTSVTAITAAEKQRQALELRKAGATLHQIADRLGYSHHSGAQKAIKLALNKTIQEPADDVRRLELERLDAATFAIWPQVRNGNFGAIDRMVRLMDRRAALLGLDAPKEFAFQGDLTSTVRVIDQDGKPAGDDI